MRANINPNVASVQPSSMNLTREVSITPQDLPPHSFNRADLVFEGIDHSDDSFEALIYVNNPKANYRTGRSAEKGYVESFNIFGHGRCFGAPGHCDISNRSLRHGDLREPHALTPLQKRVVGTAALRAALQEHADGLTCIKVVPVQRAQEGKSWRKSATKLLRFGKVTLKTY